MKKVPEVRLVMAFDGVTPAYAVIKGPHGWYGAPGLRKGQFLTDDDVADAIPLQPGPSALVEVCFHNDKSAEGFADDLYDVDINGKVAARRVAKLIAGTFIMAAAIQKAGEPVMVIATKKQENTPPVAKEIELAPHPRPKLTLADTDGNEV